MNPALLNAIAGECEMTHHFCHGPLDNVEKIMLNECLASFISLCLWALRRLLIGVPLETAESAETTPLKLAAHSASHSSAAHS